MWVDKVPSLWPKLFPWLLKVHTEINALSRPKGRPWTPPVERV